MKRALPALVFISLYAVFTTSCSSNPTACFSIVSPADSIRVGRTVSFNSSCSADATQYYWDFGNGKNSSASPIATVVYDSIGTYQVGLVVTGSGKTGSVTKSVTVLP